MLCNGYFELRQDWYYYMTFCLCHEMTQSLPRRKVEQKRWCSGKEDRLYKITEVNLCISINSITIIITTAKIYGAIIILHVGP